ncbi:MAG: hypothetical protein IKG00_08840 [Lachnospiraceae bacterium]|nr:hypothetical protein [Lachnospiraceae bacterium]
MNPWLFHCHSSLMRCKKAEKKHAVKDHTFHKLRLYLFSSKQNSVEFIDYPFLVPERLSAVFAVELVLCRKFQFLLTVYAGMGELRRRRTARTHLSIGTVYKILKAHPEEDDCVEGQMSFDDLL